LSDLYFLSARPAFRRFPTRCNHETSPKRTPSDPPLVILLWPGVPRQSRLQPGIRRVEDPHHPRGYRELRSPAEMRKLLNRKIVEQNGRCAICLEEFTDYDDIAPDHRNPKGMGGAWRDDHQDNIQAAHYWCNGEKGSTRIDD